MVQIPALYTGYSTCIKSWIFKPKIMTFTKYSIQCEILLFYLTTILNDAANV